MLNLAHMRRLLAAYDLGTMTEAEVTGAAHREVLLNLVDMLQHGESCHLFGSVCSSTKPPSPTILRAEFAVTPHEIRIRPIP
jgi:hypothetical protein